MKFSNLNKKWLRSMCDTGVSKYLQCNISSVIQRLFTPMHLSHFITCVTLVIRDNQNLQCEQIILRA